jgi:hypothetical protein
MERNVTTSRATIRLLCIQATAVSERCAERAEQAASVSEWEHYFNAWQRFTLKAEIYKELYFLSPYWN